MDAELEKKLCKRFPLLFRGRYLSLQQNLMSFGCECGRGWYRLIYMACLGLEEEINKMYPWWFRKFYTPIMIFEEAWNTLMWKLPKWLQKKTEFGEIPHLLLRFDNIPCFTQIKEKYGTLRLYMSSSSDEMNEYTDVAEKASHNTCETCGKYGTVRGKGWMYCSCDEHAKEGDLEHWEMP